METVLHTTKKLVDSILPDSIYYKQSSRPNILLFSSRRGGSSYLAGLISREPGMRFIDQPFDLNYYDQRGKDIRNSYLPSQESSQFISLSVSQIGKVRSYMSLLLDGSLRDMSDPYFSPRNRTILKICNASPLVDWFSEFPDVATIYLVRHPLAQALSVVRANWAMTSGAYLNNAKFAEKYLSSSQRRVGLRIAESGTHLEKAVLNWILENLYPLRHSQRIDLTLTYEELVLFPRLAISLMAERLNLRAKSRMLKRVTAPSWSRQFSDTQTNQAIRRNDRSFLVQKWIPKVDAPMKHLIHQMLEMFDIDEYSVESPMPNERIRHFKETALADS